MATRVQNRQRLLQKLAAMPPQVRAAAKQALAESADEIQGMQRRLAPKRTGRLARSIVQTWGGGKERYASLAGSAMSDGDPDLTVVISAGNSETRYAHLVEFGTAPHDNGGTTKGSKHPGARAQPFFFPAYRALRKRAKSRVNRAMTKAIKRITGGS
ncbi:HK97-gp10 family putative phage morphogenesis protein [Kaistia sp. MMO-174]|uniref:HK97-gp10 family putative phage morphogenesis protein n=1 Tax=Kaistia sp. MMO-174 TaxID=3081256 RepID=UPI003018C642